MVLNSLVHTLSLQTAIPKVELPISRSRSTFAILFARIRLHYSAYYSVQIEYE